MIVTHTFLDKTWIDLSSPTEEEVNSLIFTHNIDPLIAKDLLAPTPKQQAREASDSIYAVLHIPSFQNSKREIAVQEIDCLIKRSDLITCRYDSIDALHYFAKQVEVNEILNKGSFSHPFFGMMRELYKFLQDELAYTEGWLSEIERSIFGGKEKEMVFAISAVSRNMLGVKRALNPHQGVLQSLSVMGSKKWGDEFREESLLLMEEWQRLMLVVDNLEDIVNELRSTNDSMLSTKQNEIMKTLTILAFIVVPLATISQIFGMNTLYNPIVGWANDFWIVVGLMLTLALAMLALFKYKKWI